MSHLTKTETPLVLWLNIVTSVARSVRILPAHLKHTESIMRSIIWILLEIYFSFQHWKNFKNPLRINKVIAMSLVYYFLGAQCICKELFILFVTCISSICIHSVLSVNVPDCLMSSWSTETAFSILPIPLPQSVMHNSLYLVHHNGDNNTETVNVE